MTEAGFRFVPWVRRGAAAEVAALNVPATPGARATVPVAVTFNSGPAAVSGGTSLELLGPGDVVGFDARAISRTWPPAQTLDAEPNYFPAVEFDQVDLPWRYRRAGKTRRRSGSGRGCVCWFSARPSWARSRRRAQIDRWSR